MGMVLLKLWGYWRNHERIHFSNVSKNQRWLPWPFVQVVNLICTLIMFCLYALSPRQVAYSVGLGVKRC